MLVLRLGGAAVQAVPRLLAARLTLAKLHTDDLARLNAAAASTGRPADRATPADATEVRRIGYVISRSARLVPWRSDCLVQALAAQKWLLRSKIATEIVIGIDQTQAEGFLSHAWLRWGDHVVTGGKISRFTIILEPNTLSPRTHPEGQG